MKYFFILGNNKALSMAELSAIFGLREKDENNFLFLEKKVFLLESEKEISPKEIIKKIGGTIKIGKIIKEISQTPKENITQEVKKILPLRKEKIKFGFSYYGNKKFNEKRTAMEIKKYLREKNKSSRWVASKGQFLSSVVVGQNKLIEKGIEIILIENNKRLLIGKTLAIQPFKELSYRDYGRPRRDDRSGMLPPKLAQIMLNLSGAKISDTVLDPFCGSGTILNEAILAGYKNIIGSDVSAKAIADSRQNAEWLRARLGKFGKTARTGGHKLKIFQADAGALSKLIPARSISAIVTEPYLGPQRGKIDFKKTIPELEQLYSRVFAEFGKILTPAGRVIIIFPVFRAGNSLRNINPDLRGFKIICPIPKNLLNKKNIRLTERNTIIYGRPGQKIWREILILGINSPKNK